MSRVSSIIAVAIRPPRRDWVVNCHMRIRATILASLILPLIAGCSLVPYGIYISALNEDVTLAVRRLESRGEFARPEQYKLVAGKTKQAAGLIAEVTVTDSSGNVLFQQVLPPPGYLPEHEKYMKRGESKIYYLVTHDGAYPIPIEWRENWKQHQTEIVADFDVKAARQSLLEEGRLQQ